MKSRNNGWALVGFDLNSGWNWTETKPGVIAPFHDLDDRAVRAGAGRDESVLLERFAIGVVEFVAMAVSFVDQVLSR